MPRVFRCGGGEQGVEMGRNAARSQAGNRPAMLTQCVGRCTLQGTVPRGPVRGKMYTVDNTRHHEARRRTIANGIDPSATQEIIIGGAIVSSIAAALLLGFQKEKEVCSSCNGSGGVVCFACEGTGIMESASPEVEKEVRRANLGRNANRLECRACKGVGRLLCKKCGGSGYA